MGTPGKMIDHRPSPAALHEAGHAVASIVLGVAYTGVEVMGPERGWWHYESFEPDQAGRVILTVLCGHEAELLRYPEAEASTYAEDVEFARRVFASDIAPHGNADAYFAVKRIEAARLVREYRVQIEALAHALVARRRLSAVEARIIFRKATTGNPLPWILGGRRVNRLA